MGIITCHASVEEHKLVAVGVNPEEGPLGCPCPSGARFKVRVKIRFGVMVEVRVRVRVRVGVRFLPGSCPSPRPDVE